MGASHCDQNSPIASDEGRRAGAAGRSQLALASPMSTSTSWVDSRRSKSSDSRSKTPSSGSRFSIPLALFPELGRLDGGPLGLPGPADGCCVADIPGQGCIDFAQYGTPIILQSIWQCYMVLSYSGFETMEIRSVV